MGSQLRLQQYQFKLRHRPGKTNPADVLSRKLCQHSKITALQKITVCKFFNRPSIVPKSMYRQEIEEACQKDAEMQALITAIRKNRWPRKPAGNTNNKQQ
jgi:hypothetical protein